MLPQELLLLSQDDVIVLRAGIPPLRGKKLRYYKDKWMVAASSVAPPPVAPRPIDPMVAKRSLAIIAATEAPEMRSEEHTSELQSLMRISYAVFCLKKKKKKKWPNHTHHEHRSTATPSTNEQLDNQN